MNKQPALIYQRDQVEQAIEKVVSRSEHPHAARVSIKADIKRLLDNDRSPKTAKLDFTHDHYAFFDGPLPGRGGQIGYTPSDAFALWAGWQLLVAGLPQGHVVKLLRDVRDDLAAEYRRIIGLGASAFNDGATQALIADGFLVSDVSRFSYFVTAAGTAAGPIAGPGRAKGEPTLNICSTQAHFEDRKRSFSHAKVAFIALELVNAAYQLTYWLERSIPRKRGPRG